MTYFEVLGVNDLKNGSLMRCKFNMRPAEWLKCQRSIMTSVVNVLTH